MESNIATALTLYAELGKPAIELLNKDKTPVAALYMNSVDIGKLVISSTNNSERYYLYYDGLGVYFTYYRPLD